MATWPKTTRARPGDRVPILQSEALFPAPGRPACRKGSCRCLCHAAAPPEPRAAAGTASRARSGASCNSSETGTTRAAAAGRRRSFRCRQGQRVIAGPCTGWVGGKRGRLGRPLHSPRQQSCRSCTSLALLLAGVDVDAECTGPELSSLRPRSITAASSKASGDGGHRSWPAVLSWNSSQLAPNHQDDLPC